MYFFYSNIYYKTHSTLIKKRKKVLLACLIIHNATHIYSTFTWQVKWLGDAGKININGTDFDLIQIHWHIPSEHTINGLKSQLLPF